MSRIINIHGLMVFEHPPTTNKADYEIDKHGDLFVFGYETSPFPFMPPIASMKKFNLNLSGAKILGQYNEAKEKTEVDLFKIVRQYEIETKNAVFIKLKREPPKDENLIAPKTKWMP